MKNIFYFSTIILINIFNKVFAQLNNPVTNNFNALYANNYNDNQNVNLNNRQTENHQAVLYTTNQNPLLQTQYVTNNVAKQNVVTLNPTTQQRHKATQYYTSEVQVQPQHAIGTQTVQSQTVNRPTSDYDATQFSNSAETSYQNNQQDRSKQNSFNNRNNNNNNNQRSRSSLSETQYSSSNITPKRRSAQQQQQYYSNGPDQEQYSEETQYSSYEQQSRQVTVNNGKRSGPRGRALGHQKNGKNRNINNNSPSRGNSLQAKLKNINKLVANDNEQVVENEPLRNAEQYKYQYSPGWSKNERFNRNDFVKPQLDYNKNSKYSTPNAPQAQYYQKFYNIYNDVQRIGDIGDNEMESINDDFNGRSIVAPGQYPHMAAIGFLSNEEKIEFKCGGSLISDSFVITAAHCCSLSGETPLIVKLGIINLKDQTGNIEPQRKAIKEIILHPGYNASMNYNDIALLQLQSPVEFTKFVRPILLWASDNIPYERVFTMGYGSTSFAKAPTNILTELSLSLIPLQECKRILPRDEKTPYGILDTQMCGRDLEKNRDTCQGDSGGPLQLNLEHRTKHNFYRYYLVGIISYGEFCGSKKPGVYTRVSSYCRWIASIVWPEYFQGF